MTTSSMISRRPNVLCMEDAEAVRLSAAEDGEKKEEKEEEQEELVRTCLEGDKVHQSVFWVMIGMSYRKE